MIRFVTMATIFLLNGCAAPGTGYRPPDTATFRVPHERARLYWDLRNGAAPILSVARDSGLYPGVPDTMIDLQCGPDGRLSVGSLRVRVATDVGGRVKPRLSVSGGGVVLTGPDRWRSTGYDLILEELRLSPGPAQWRALLAGELCLVETYPDGSEGRSCYRPPPPALAARFLSACGAG